MSRLAARTGVDRLPRGAACGMVRLVLYGVESGAVGIPDALERHRGACLACQAATVRQRQVIRGLVSLRHEWEPLPYDMAAVLDEPCSRDRTLSAAPEDPGEPGVARHPSVRAAVASAASIAAIGLVVLAGRRIRAQVS